MMRQANVLRLYRGRALPTDRFVGVPCGCVLLSKRHDEKCDGEWAECETFFACDDHSDHWGQVRDFTTASTYCFLETGAQGVMWQ